MKTTPALLCFFLSFTAVHSEPAQTQATSGTNSVVTAATLKERLVESLRADIKAIGSAEADMRKSSMLSKFISILQNDNLTGTYESASNERFEYYLRAEGVSEKSSTLCADYLKQFKQEASAAKKKFTEDAIQSGRAALKKAIASKSAEEIQAIAGEVQMLTSQMDSRSGANEYQSQFYKLKNILDNLARLQGYSTNEGWGEVASLLGQIEKNLRELPGLIPAEEAKTCMDQLRQRIGLPAPVEMPQILQELIDQLFDESKQDSLDEIAEKIKSYQSLAGSSSSIYYNSSSSARWQALYSLALSFSQGVRQVKSGGSSQFSPEHWMRDGSETKGLISARDLQKRVRNYKVKVDDGNGNITTEPMFYDMKEVMERMQTLADVRRELPAFKKAQRYQSSNSDGNEWSQVAPSLEYFVSIGTKLESGEAFNLTMENIGYSESRRYYPLATDHPASRKLIALNEQMQRMILRRFYPEISADEKSSVPKIMAAQLEKAKSSKTYREIITLSQLAQFFNPGQPLFSYQEIAAINFYLSGLRQDEELLEPRLATYYFQKAAAIRSEIIPLEELKSRLHRLKKDSPADYEKGTDDTFKANPEDASASIRFLQFQLIVPAAK
ncbi:MAG: hypothetical protein H8M99_12755 [Gloeobacteraceae cyanobacterium ES-bin-144]|nr:hypothetical protein [Verrucomicrobiales bacterium]